MTVQVGSLPGTWDSQTRLAFEPPIQVLESQVRTTKPRFYMALWIQLGSKLSLHLHGSFFNWWMASGLGCTSIALFLSELLYGFVKARGL